MKKHCMALALACLASGAAGNAQQLNPVQSSPAADVVPLVSHAGEVVTLQPPVSWHVWEIPAGREIRVVVTPADLPDRGRLKDGMWVAVHHPDVANQEQPLATRMASRFRLHAGLEAVPGPRSAIQLREASGLQQEFTLPRADGAATRGVYVLADTAWGTIEILGLSPGAKYSARKKEFQQILSSLRFNAPRKPGVIAPESKAAQSIFGSWKAYRSRIRLHGDGKVEVILDRPVQLTRAPRGQVGLGSQPLTGAYRAERDLIFVRWDDGSQLNFRWRLDRNTLLLTDHQGQTVSLRRLVN